MYNPEPYSQERMAAWGDLGKSLIQGISNKFEHFKTRIDTEARLRSIADRLFTQKAEEDPNGYLYQKQIYSYENPNAPQLIVEGWRIYEINASCIQFFDHSTLPLEHKQEWFDLLLKFDTGDGQETDRKITFIREKDGRLSLLGVMDSGSEPVEREEEIQILKRATAAVEMNPF